MPTPDKSAFFGAVARYESFSPVLTRYDIYFRVEAQEDIRFWEQMLYPACRGRKVKFLPYVQQSTNKITGKSYILKNRQYASPQYILCIDSDFDYLLGTDQLDAQHYILQTYTYSWENHHCLRERIQQYCDVLSLTPSLPFQWPAFVSRLSEIIYRPLLILLWHKKQGHRKPKLDDVCRAFSSIQPNRKAWLENNGALLLEQLQSNLTQVSDLLVPEGAQASLQQFEAEMAKKGLRPETAYLYMQGHAVYDFISRVGKALYEESFEQQVLLPSFAAIACQYPELEKVQQDVDVVLQ